MMREEKICSGGNIVLLGKIECAEGCESMVPRRKYDEGRRSMVRVEGIL